MVMIPYCVVLIYINALKYQLISFNFLMINHIYVQQVPEEIDRVMVGVEAYLSIRKHVSDDGLSFFVDNEENESRLGEKVIFF